ncbi:hypothetical protein [Pyxidicoccus sp. MSG2]|uniref:hypothetical protein n=1 Tax=Pyxidicoccus sp. MSG2 TaxID=2996790 RepID=UPI0022711115|nr:hypothetical protein [Pyxidicoccus sp. MSG2]MCY1015890.1 hypothetical protein [Pyxidicoccus sp. MSG2]
MSKSRADRVELLNIPDYRQGTHDGLCTYYSCAMLLATLHPEYQSMFGVGDRRRKAGLVVEDPLIKHFPRDGVNTTSDKALASWFYGGSHLLTAKRLLNRIMRHDGHKTRFVHAQETKHDNTFDVIAESIDQGLPVLIGWNTGDFGDHTVVVRGYKISQLRWFLLRDPSGDERISWESLKATMTARMEVLRVNPATHAGLRPDKLSHVDDGWKIERWWHQDGRQDYFDVKELFASASVRVAEQEDDADDDE